MYYSIVKTQAVQDFKECVYERYQKQTGYKPSFYGAVISDGITVTKL